MNEIPVAGNEDMLTNNPLTGGGIRPDPGRPAAGYWGWKVIPTPAYGKPACVVVK